MILLPTFLLVSTLLGLVSLLVLAAGIGLLLRSMRARRHVRMVMPDGSIGDAALAADGSMLDRPPRSAASRSVAWVPLVIGLALLAWTFAGRHVVLMTRPSDANDAPVPMPMSSRTLNSPTGAVLAVHELGPHEAPTLIMTHGWGADSREWRYAQGLADRFHVVLWDLPGLGASTAYTDGDYTLDRMAQDLDTVVNGTTRGPVVLVGHSIGGMINLTYARLHPADLGNRVRGLVELNTTYTNPVRTTRNSAMAERLQKPVLEPALHVMVALAPLVRAVAWLNYRNGLTHLHLHSQSFAGAETRDQLDFAARYAYRSSPAVVARGTLAMLHWDATDVLPRVSVPTLIVSGDLDTTTLPTASMRMKESMPHAEHRPIALAAHLGPIEQHARYVATIADFARRVMS